jgi:hypothetical protein
MKDVDRAVPRPKVSAMRAILEHCTVWSTARTTHIRKAKVNAPNITPARIVASDRSRLSFGALHGGSVNALPQNLIVFNCILEVA